MARKYKYRAENSHLIEGRQVNRTVAFLATSDEAAKERFKGMRKADPTIHEAGLFRVRGNELVADYIGYC